MKRKKSDEDESSRPLSLAERADFNQTGATFFSQCNTCAYYWGRDGRCDAFPAGIPPSIVANQIIHDHPVPKLGQDNKIVYALKGTVNDSLAQLMNGEESRAE